MDYTVLSGCTQPSNIVKMSILGTVDLDILIAVPEILVGARA